MDCPIQNVSQNMLNGWPHTESLMSTLAPYRMFFHTYYMGGPYRMLIITC